MLKTLRNATNALYVTVAGGVLVGGSMIMYFQHRHVQMRVRSLDHYRESLMIVRNHPRACDELGPPIELGKVDVSDRLHNYVDKHASRLRIPVAGRINTGILDICALRESETAPFQTVRLMLLLDNGPEVTIYELPERRWNEHDPMRKMEKERERRMVEERSKK